MSAHPDILVIGGGMAGISAAALLAEEARVTVLEAEPHIGMHSTGRSAAIFILNYGNATLRALNAAAYPVLSGRDSGVSFLSPRGELLVAQAEEMDTLDAYLEGTTGIERLTPDEAQALVPVLRTERIAGAIIERDAQDIDVDLLLQSYARQLRARGGAVLTGEKVQSITREAEGWRVETTQNTHSAAIVINAAGAWADEVASLAGVRPIGLQPMRRSAVMMPVPDGVQVAAWPLFGSISETWYAKPSGAALMISPADEDPLAPQDAWPDDMVLAEGLYRFEQMVDIPVVRPTHSWAGLRSFVSDRSPVAGFAPDAPGFFWLAGQGGYGIQTAPALAALTRDLCLQGESGFAPGLLAALSPERLYQSAD
ncbi:FAD-binding oxidoreductase [Roseovarius faecimaris]|uniref:FAD-binding oxidoreductase n=1 Tax=Roseovarius faecimaris TaxID=2494550 RepID=A0A6I6INX8_9RHOB|nr:FAD-binding oxidoreductase [Roseovarius faecimaris]QGX97227.1 FAD-binding oxidoreductase [Roseovarius faecimaris]